MQITFSRKRSLAALFLLMSLTLLVGQSAKPSPLVDEDGHVHDDGESIYQLLTGAACIKATPEEIAVVDQGNEFYNDFIKKCVNATGASTWCEELTRPNPDSADIFECTYGPDQPHRFIHPDKSTWENAFEAVRIIGDLQAKGIGVKRIYNWWRPEPYNKNVDGAGGRHPFGTAVDVEFSSQQDKDAAFKALCQMRSEGRLKAIGYYPSLGLHLGVNDKMPNTWGRSCQ